MQSWTDYSYGKTEDTIISELMTTLEDPEIKITYSINPVHNTHCEVRVKMNESITIGDDEVLFVAKNSNLRECLRMVYMETCNRVEKSLAHYLGLSKAFINV